MALPNLPNLSMLKVMVLLLVQQRFILGLKSTPFIFIKVVAEQMGRLSSATKISDMIATAKEIANAIGEICALAQAQADLCADPKLRDQLVPSLKFCQFAYHYLIVDCCHLNS